MAEVLLHGGASLELNSACDKGSELCIRDVSKGVSPPPALLRESTSDERSRNADRAPETAGEDRSAGAGSAGRSDPARLAVIQHAGEVGRGLLFTLQASHMSTAMVSYTARR